MKLELTKADTDALIAASAAVKFGDISVRVAPLGAYSHDTNG